MSFQDVGRTRPAGVVRAGVGVNGAGPRPVSGGFGAARNGGAVGGSFAQAAGKGAGGGSTVPGAAGASSGAGAGVEQDPQTARLSECLMQYSQNVTIMHRIVQSLGGIRDTAEVRHQYHCQLGVVTELAAKIQADLQAQAKTLDDRTRQDAARLRATHAKLSKDYARVGGIAKELIAEATKRIDEADRHRRAQLALEEEARSSADRRETADAAADAERLHKLQLQEEAINQAIIEETEEELRHINRSLYTVNEIYRDLANIVAQQQEQVEHIEVTTEAAHQRAQHGLSQVQKANNSQSSCVIS